MAFSLVTMAGGCASIGGHAVSAEEDFVDEDPLEGLNRHVFAANLAIDTFLLRPAAVAYRELMPQPGKYVIRNFVNNLKLPWTFLNDLAQGEGNRAGVAFARFIVNSTIGIGGLFDPATDMGLPYHKEDFGQTLAVWGVEEGPYLVLPLFGPSNFRDAIGTGVAYFGDPARIAADATDLENEYLATQVADAVDSRYRNLRTIDSLRERSLDFYATVRSLYKQRRADEIRNGNVDPSLGSLGSTVLSENVKPPEGTSPHLLPSTIEVPSTRRMEEAALSTDVVPRRAPPMDQLDPRDAPLPLNRGGAAKQLPAKPVNVRVPAGNEQASLPPAPTPIAVAATATRRVAAGPQRNEGRYAAHGHDAGANH